MCSNITVYQRLCIRYLSNIDQGLSKPVISWLDPLPVIPQPMIDPVCPGEWLNQFRCRIKAMPHQVPLRKWDRCLGDSKGSNTTNDMKTGTTVILESLELQFCWQWKLAFTYFNGLQLWDYKLSHQPMPWHPHHFCSSTFHIFLHACFKKMCRATCNIGFQMDLSSKGLLFKLSTPSRKKDSLSIVRQVSSS